MRVWGRTAGAVAGAVCLLLVGVSGAGADSSAPVDGLWWYDAAGIGDAVASGATGAGVTVAVIDGQINPQVPVLAGADVRVHEPSYCKADVTASAAYVPAATTDWSDASSHGTNVVSMIVGTGKGAAGSKGASGVAPKATVRFYADGRGDNVTTKLGKGLECISPRGPESMTDAIVQAVDDGARIISVSLTAPLGKEGLEAVAWAEHQGVVVVEALPNETGNFLMSSLDTLNGVVSVKAIGPDLKPHFLIDGEQGWTDVLAPGWQMLLQGSSKTRSWQDTEIGQGDSYAAPFVAGVLAAVWSKYPKATGNQLIQSLIHNTGGQDHALDFDDTAGYGIVSEAHMLRVDPTQYPDVNPLLTEKGYKDFVSQGMDFTAAQVAAATRPAWAPPLAGDGSSVSPASTSSASSTATGAASPTSVGASTAGVPWWVFAGGGFLVVLVGALVIGLTRGRRHTPVASAPAPR